MNILLTGASGQLGRELVRVLGKHGKVTGVDRTPGIAGSIRQDISDLHQLEILLNRQRPDIVINAAAYTAVDQAENDHHLAFRVNAELPACLARWCRNNDRFLLHYSTDYVFNGEGAVPYPEDHVPQPLGVYGESKLAGEWAVGASKCRHVILRTSWVYSTHGNNFVLKMLALARERPELSIVCDQTGCPTWARNLAWASDLVLTKSIEDANAPATQGVFHYCDSGVTTWYDFARLIFEQAAALQLISEIPLLKPIPSAAFPALARRPSYSVLDTRSIRAEFGVTPRGLEPSLRACLEELET